MAPASTEPTDGAQEPDRFDRQVRFAPLGRDGQERLQKSRVLLVGCGALGGSLAQILVRAGVGTLLLCDRDVVESSNLPRQVLFDDADARQARPKAEAARDTLARIGGPTSLEVHVVHVDANNLPTLAADCDLILDGTDNLATRYLINDLALERDLPWVYAGVVSSHGLVLAVRPQKSACLRCLFPEPPPAGSLDTCETAGVILPAVGLVASLAAGQGLRLLTRPESFDTEPPRLAQLDAWSGELRTLAAPRDPDCPACGPKAERAFLHGGEGGEAVRLCGRNAVQLPAAREALDLASVATRLAPIATGELERTASFLRARIEPYRLTLFQDGRALVEGTEDLDRARAFYDRLVGS